MLSGDGGTPDAAAVGQTLSAGYSQPALEKTRTLLHVSGADGAAAVLAFSMNQFAHVMRYAKQPGGGWTFTSLDICDKARQVLDTLDQKRTPDTPLTPERGFSSMTVASMFHASSGGCGE